MKLSQLNPNKQKKMETIQAINDGADEEDFKELLEILKQFGNVEVLYNPYDPKDKDITGDEVIKRYENFKKKVKMDANTLNDTEDEETREDGSSTEECISGPIKMFGGYRRRSRLNETDTTISTAA